ncbi:hypothetical protein [Halorubrum lacusprofundi]|jgi:hypothetical protein|uniref:RING-type E3 ubiquitin transferase n=1 Tax=Halorubrum lacusprofundi (strain ATCC 49239 / DSM 5036 / JCM 8891 / ACAM 34) TaxID=416348 RepID=B9LSB9_HALLT|nr:hypothetical protein [Halorubrum lacusprofundi]ACM55964.1 conserved hypothetical protein [Halorubrum lacusprofundi ATCC 49239]MCG1006831.1 hypothetical protein [Halorubrum lacusprofundi]
MSLHSTLAAHPTPLRVTIDPLPTLIGVAALLVSLGFLARGGRGSLDALRVARATATDPRSLQAGDRRVRVTGRAEIASGAHGRSDDDKEDAETLPAPFSDEQCLCCAYDVSEYRSQGKGRSWVSIDSGEAGVPFRVVVDGVGVRVDPAAADFAFGVDEDIEIAADETPPERVRRFTDAVEAVDESEMGWTLGPLTIGDDPERRYRQRVLRPGDGVTVVGDATAFPDAPVGEVKARIDGGSPFVVGDANARRTALRLVGRSAVPVVLGAVSLTVAAFALSPILGAVVG